MDDLIARLEKADGPDRELDCEIWVALHGNDQPMKVVGEPVFKDNRYFCNPNPDIDWFGYDLLNIVEPYTASLDAKLPGDDEAHWVIDGPRPEGWYATRSLVTNDLAIVTEGCGKTEAIARRIAALQARQSGERDADLRVLTTKDVRALLKADDAIVGAEAAMERIAALEGAVADAARVFRHYERLHAEKNSPTGHAKMLANRALAEQMGAALAPGGDGGEGRACPTCGGARVVSDGAHYSGLGKDYGGMYCPACTGPQPHLTEPDRPALRIARDIAHSKLGTLRKAAGIEPDRPEGECPHGCVDGWIETYRPGPGDEKIEPCPIHGTGRREGGGDE